MAELGPKEERARAVARAIAEIELAEALADPAARRTGIAAALEALAARADLFPAATFPRPDRDGTGRRYTLHAREDGRLPLYLSILRGPLRTPAHDHKVWAGVAAIEGASVNLLYAAPGPGGGPPVPAGRVEVAPGRSLVTEPEAIHGVEVAAGMLCANLLIYGVALDRLRGARPETYDLSTGDRGPYDGG